jgi:hypothetical protein
MKRLMNVDPFVVHAAWVLTARSVRKGTLTLDVSRRAYNYILVARRQENHVELVEVEVAA